MEGQDKIRFAIYITEMEGHMTLSYVFPTGFQSYWKGYTKMSDISLLDIRSRSILFSPYLLKECEKYRIQISKWKGFFGCLVVSRRLTSAVLQNLKDYRDGA